MNLYDRRCDGADGIVESYAGVGVGTGIEDDAIDGEAHLMEFVDEGALMIALEIVYLHVGVLRPQLLQIVIEGASTIDVGFAAAEEVEVGTVEDEDCFHIWLLAIGGWRLATPFSG